MNRMNDNVYDYLIDPQFLLLTPKHGDHNTLIKMKFIFEIAFNF